MNNSNYNARKIKKIYERFRRKITPKYFCGPKFDDHWFKLSNFLESINACPVLYLEAQFEGWGSTPFPHQLCSMRAKQIYEKYLEQGGTIGEKEFVYQVNFLRECVKTYAPKEEDSIDKVLLLDFIPLKAYIRVLLCDEKNLPEIMQKYGAIAYAEIKSNPSIDKYLKENYVSRYQRLFPQRLSKVDSSSHDTLPEPTSTSSIRKDIPKRRRLANT